MSVVLDALKYRYSVKHFDANGKVSEQEEQTILESINLTATSYGLQPFRVISVRNKDLKEQLRLQSYNQSQISEADLILVFAIEKNVNEQFVDRYIANITKHRNVEEESLLGYSQAMKNGIVKGLDQTKRDLWAKKQVYIALGSAMVVVGELKLDSCPMEGFVAHEYDKILGLHDVGLESVVVLAVGKRSTQDKHQHDIKVRRSLEDLVIKRY